MHEFSLNHILIDAEYLKVDSWTGLDPPGLPVDLSIFY